MKSMPSMKGIKLVVLGLILAASFHTTVLGQDLPPQRQIRTYVPPDQLVSFLPSTPFDRFVDFLNPIFTRITGKQLIDPDGRNQPIGISIAGMHFIDALELVLQYNRLRYRETDRFFVIEKAPEGPAVILDADQAAGRGKNEGGINVQGNNLPATIDTREIQINAILFELNHTRARDLGINWSVFLGSGSTGGGGSGGNSGGGNSGGGGNGTGASKGTRDFVLNTKKLFSGVDNVFQAPDQINFKDLNEFFRVAEQQGLGQTVANPSVTVQSGEKGRIQIGTDVPVQVRDFAGNTVTQFFSTGIIVDVTPTLIAQAIADTLNSPLLDFIHLDVRVEKSGSTPSAAGPVIDRNSANTQVLLLDGEQTVIGGLYSTDKVSSRTGIPILKDLPPWFFGLRYVFGREQNSTTQKELLIVLQARVRDTLTKRARQPLRDDILKEQRRMIQEALRRFNQDVQKDTPAMKRYQKDAP